MVVGLLAFWLSVVSKRLLVLMDSRVLVRQKVVLADPRRIAEMIVMLITTHTSTALKTVVLLEMNTHDEYKITRHTGKLSQNSCYYIMFGPLGHDVFGSKNDGKFCQVKCTSLPADKSCRSILVTDLRLFGNPLRGHNINLLMNS